MCAAVFVASLLAADLNETAKKELNALEGEWTVVATAVNDKETEVPVDERIAVTVSGAKFTFGKFGDARVTALDPTTTPKILDFKMLRKPESGVRNEAIYKFQKDTLTVVVYLGEGSKRPGSFDVPKDMDTMRFTLKRLKK